MKIAYKKRGWKATDIRFVSDDYATEHGELLTYGDVLPTSEQLSDQPPPMPPQEVIVKLEMENPITHRALRELILTIGEAFPAGKETVFYKRVLQTELAIRAEREKL